jgi:hypothetical protein
MSTQKWRIRLSFSRVFKEKSIKNMPIAGMRWRKAIQLKKSPEVACTAGDFECRQLFIALNKVPVYPGIHLFDRVGAKQNFAGIVK